MTSDAKTVPAYLQGLPDERRKDLSKLRQLIRRVVPEAKELMKYGHPHYELNGGLFALASQKHYLALYVADHAAVARCKPRLGKASFGKSCIRFKELASLNLDTVEELLILAARSRM